MLDINTIDVLVPNFKYRLSGVTATIVRLLPLQAKNLAIAAVAPNLPLSIPQVPLWSLLTMSRYGPSGYRVWHARRNNEMLAGLLLSWLLRKKLKFVFTSASQRHHTRWTKFLIRHMDAVIATSEKTASYLEVPAQIIYHGIDLDTFHPPKDRCTLRNSLNLPQDARIIGCFGRIRHQKGTDLFIQTAIRLCRDFPDLHAIALGRALPKDQTFLKNLQQRINTAGFAERIRFLEEVPVWEMPVWYQALDLYIAPQRWEGFGLTPLEAMACGVPVVAADVGAFRELIVEGQTGFVVENGSADALYRKSSMLLQKNNETLYSRIKAASYQQSKVYYDIKKEADKIDCTYKKILF